MAFRSPADGLYHCYSRYCHIPSEENGNKLSSTLTVEGLAGSSVTLYRNSAVDENNRNLENFNSIRIKMGNALEAALYNN